MSEKSYVGMTQCFWCGDTKNEILLDRRLKDSLPRKAVYDKEPCDKCRDWMTKGVILISVDAEKSKHDPQNPYRTGGMAVITDEAVTKIFDTKMANQLKEQRVGFLEDEAWRMLGLPHPGDEKKEEDNSDE